MYWKDALLRNGQHSSGSEIEEKSLPLTKLAFLQLCLTRLKSLKGQVDA